MSMSKLIISASGSSHPGSRKCLEDFTVGNVEYLDSFFAVFDGHGGDAVARFVRANLWENIKSMKHFYSDDDDEIKRAIMDGFVKTQKNIMCKRLNTLLPKIFEAPLFQ